MINTGPMGWVQRQMNLGINPREILSYMVPHAKVVRTQILNYSYIDLSGFVC